MLTSLADLTDLFESMAVLALLAPAYGVLMRGCARPWIAQLALGALFGGAAIWAMSDPLHIAEGVFIDLRNVPLTLAGAFLGPIGAAWAVGLALTVRVTEGGLGVVPAVLSAAIAAGVGLGWAELRGRAPAGPGSRIWILAVLSCLALLTGALLPATIAARFFEVVVPVIVPLQVLSVLVVGHLLDRERRLLDGERRLARDGQHDPLTGVLNRRGFELAVAPHLDSEVGAALLLLDLDHFKSVNDRFGHAAGDVVLSAVGERVAPLLRAGDILARLGGEEFAIYLPAVSPRGVERIASRVCEDLRAVPFALPDGRGLTVTGSIGAAWTERPIGLTVLTKHADAALYAAKARGRNRHVLERLDQASPAPAPKLRLTA